MIDDIIEDSQDYSIVFSGGQTFYKIKLPKLMPKEMSYIKFIKDSAIIDTNIEIRGLTKEHRKLSAIKELQNIIMAKGDEVDIKSEKVIKILEMVANDMVGYGLLEPLLSDDNIEEIMVIGSGSPVYVFHRKHGMCETNVVFSDAKEIIKIIERIASSIGRRIDLSTPLLDARLRDGSRVNATLSPPSLTGPTITIRKFKKDPMTIIDLVNYNTLDSGAAAFIWAMVDGLGVRPSNVLISGGTGSGKTTTLNSISIFVRGRDRILTIEDTAELQLPVKHIVRFETRPPSVEGKGEIDMDILLKNALRMRPDRIIVGEVRGPEAKTLFNAMNTGHDGTMGTVHANTARETITRLTNEPMSVPIIMVPALNLIIMQGRFIHPEKGPIRRIREITEVVGVKNNRVELNQVFKWEIKDDILKRTQNPSVLIQSIGENTGLTIEEIENEIQKRKEYLDSMIAEGIREDFNIKKNLEDYYKK